MALSDLLVHGERPNAVIGWSLLAVVAAVAVWFLAAGAILWGLFAGLLVVVTALLPLWTRNWRAMVPWPLVGLLAGAVLLRAWGSSPELAGYLAVAGLALMAVVEIDASTSVEMSRQFAVFFAVLTTMAIQSWWTIAQYYSDRWFDTGFLVSQTELQWDLFLVTVVGLVLGGLFQWYFERFEHVGSHRRPIIPEDG
jgi:hypothetical protein